MFSQTVEYALRTVVHLADHSPAARTTEQIAAATLVPKAYLSKVIQGLCAANVLQSRRGVGGGIALVKTPSELTILDVVNAVEPIARIDFCPLGLQSHGVHLCPLHRRMDNALAMVQSAFRETTLAEILAEPTTSRPLCELPSPIQSGSEPNEKSAKKSGGQPNSQSSGKPGSKSRANPS